MQLAGGREAEVHNLGRLVLGLVSVGAVVLLMERCDEFAEDALVERAGRHGDGQLVGLSGVAEVDGPQPLDACLIVALVTHRGRRAVYELVEDAVDALEIGVGDVGEVGADEVSFRSGLEEADGGE